MRDRLIFAGQLVVHAARRGISDRARRSCRFGRRHGELLPRHQLGPDAAMGLAGLGALCRHDLPVVPDRVLRRLPSRSSSAFPPPMRCICAAGGCRASSKKSSRCRSPFPASRSRWRCCSPMAASATFAAPGCSSSSATSSSRMPFMVRSVMAVFATDRHQDARRRRGVARRLAVAALSRRDRAQRACPAFSPER